MAYNEVPITKAMQDLTAEYRTEKDKPTYNAQAWDDRVIDEIDRLCKIANRYVQQSAQLVEGKRNHANSLIESMERLLKGDNFGDKQLKAIQGSAVIIKRNAEEAHADRSELDAALKTQYRGGWPEEARKSLRPESHPRLNPYLATRAKEIADGKTSVALSRRLDEYVERSKELVKQALDLKMNTGTLEAIQAECARLKDELQATYDKLVRDNLSKAKNNFDRAVEISKKKTITKPEHTLASAVVKDNTTIFKNVRGTVKTMLMQYEGLVKRAKGVAPDQAKALVKTLKEAKELVDLAAKNSKTIDQQDKDGTAKLKSIENKMV